MPRGVTGQARAGRREVLKGLLSYWLRSRKKTAEEEGATVTWRSSPTTVTGFPTGVQLVLPRVRFCSKVKLVAEDGQASSRLPLLNRAMRRVGGCGRLA